MCTYVFERERERKRDRERERKRERERERERECVCVDVCGHALEIYVLTYVNENVSKQMSSFQN